MSKWNDVLSECLAIKQGLLSKANSQRGIVLHRSRGRQGEAADRFDLMRFEDGSRSRERKVALACISNWPCKPLCRLGKSFRMLLKNKTAVITGANRGIGEAILRTFAENGARIFACARKESPEFSQLIQTVSAEAGATIEPIYFDFRNEIELKAATAKINASKIKIDVIVNNAGAALGGLFQLTPMRDLREMFEVNFLSQVQFTQGLSRSMARSKGGSIINIGSTAGLIGNAGTTSYGSSKAALMYATKVMASELGAANIRVNAIAPGITKTEMFDLMDEKSRDKQIEVSALRRPAEASEIASVALFLASDLSTYVSGQVIRVDGGMTT